MRWSLSIFSCASARMAWAFFKAFCDGDMVIQAIADLRSERQEYN